MGKINQIDFSGNDIFIGLDTHYQIMLIKTPESANWQTGG